MHIMLESEKDYHTSSPIYFCMDSPLYPGYARKAGMTVVRPSKYISSIEHVS